MDLYNEWKNTVVDYVKNNGEEAFWEEYGAVQKSIFANILSTKKTELSGKISDLASQYGVSNVFFIGFLDSLNSSLPEPISIEEISEDSEICVKLDFEKLYGSMLKAGTDYLYNLPQWEIALSLEKRRNLKAKYKGMIPKKASTKIGRNDVCPCGSGLKYKNCCGKN